MTHTFGRNAGVVQTFDKDVVRFGRAPEGDVVFDADYDRDASANHAEARREGASWLLVDLKSRNGTFVGGERVERHTLSAGDEVAFGPKGPRVRVDFTTAAPEAGSQGANGTVAAEPAGVAPARKVAKKPLPGTAAYPVHPGPPVGAPPSPPRPEPDPAYAHAQSAPRISAPSGPAMPAPPAGKRVGQRTIAELISSAVAAARGQRPQKMSTRVLADYVDKQVGAATAGQRRTTMMLGLVLIASMAGLFALMAWSRSSNDEIDRLREQLGNLPPDDPHRKDIEGRLGSLHPSNASFGRNLYDQSKKGIFMLASGGRGFCTAFAVKPSVLATNAHCVLAARKHGGTIVALENEGRGGISFPVSDMRTHPAYRESDQHSITPDVGIINISGRAAVVLTMASAQELASVGAGDDVYLIGFPGRLMDTSNPAATFLAAHVGRVTNSGGRPGSFTDNWLVQHDASTTHGTSGSPIFNGRGKVIAINAGGYLESDDQTVAGRKTEVVKASPYKFGMRIDLLNAVLR
ncbi:Methylcrotonyl-CoA carboxylase biotin-containing subunit protein [Minicystis rosea]|nr:Methylcrotonyl-CoA carboxylase biotin-containing subunit protein [Minicystis rosea]